MECEGCSGWFYLGCEKFLPKMTEKDKVLCVKTANE